MDTISTGIGGALLARALPPEKAGPAALLAVTLGSVVSDADVVVDFLSHDPLAVLTVHRGFTHSLVGVAVIAPLLALLLRRFTPDKNFRRLVALVALGMLWHLFTDLATSWGTMVFYPFSRERVVWDWMFIVDFVFSAILLLPHVVAWIAAERPGAVARAGSAWAALAAFAALVIRLVSPFFGETFPWSLFLLLAGILAALLFGPLLKGWGFRQSPALFCRIGVVALAAYYGLCAGAHAVAVKEVRRFAAVPGAEITAVAAIPQPLSPFRWTGLVLTPQGVYQSWFNVLADDPPRFEFFPSATNDFVARAQTLPAVKTYLWFARFPVARYQEVGQLRVVEYSDRRFSSPPARNSAFVLRVVFDARGEVLSSGFARR